MSAANYNITINQGADFSLPMVIKDNGVPRDLSGLDARAEMRPTKKANAPLTATFVCTISVPSSGGIVMSMANGITGAIIPGLYYYDMETYSAGDVAVKRIIGGTVSVTEEVTR